MSGLKKRWLYIAAIIAALLQSGVMLAGVQQRISILRNGTEVVLRTEPLDPRDLMRGDYVILNYDMSRLPARMIKGEPPRKSGLNYIYVVLAKQPDGLWKAEHAQFVVPTDLPDGQIFVRGEVQAPIQTYDENSLVRATYGIERYYVPEGEGRVIENVQLVGDVDVVLSVNDQGVAAIRALRFDGQKMIEEPLF